MRYRKSLTAIPHRKREELVKGRMRTMTANDSRFPGRPMAMLTLGMYIDSVTAVLK